MGTNVKINGKTIVLEKSSNIAEMLDERKVSGKMFVVEQNLKVVPKEKYTQTPVKNNDSFEIVGFFGGG